MPVWEQQQAVPAFRDDEAGGPEFRALDLTLDQTQDYRRRQKGAYERGEPSAQQGRGVNRRQFVGNG
jgi:hypothetical protein